MPANLILVILEEVLTPIVEIVEKVIEGAHGGRLYAERRTLRIDGPGNPRNIIDTRPIPRMSYYERNNIYEGPCGVPKYDFDMCDKDLYNLTITKSIPAHGRKFTYLSYTYTATCMAISGVLAGSCDPSHGIHPVPCGTDCLLYTSVTDEELDQITAALKGQPQSKKASS